MALSLEAVAEALRNQRESNLSKAANAAARAAVLGSKGNSGLILAHWFQGLSLGIGDRDKLQYGELAPCYSDAAKHVYASISDPVEGTILTAMRAIGEAALVTVTNQADADIADLFKIMISAASEAMEQSASRLDVLREANVVDAGALGLVYFLEGALAALRGDVVESTDAKDQAPLTEIAAIHAIPESDHQFCTEVVVVGVRQNAAELRKLFQPLGSSLVVATSGDLMKVHVHTNRPGAVLRLGSRLGKLAESKVDDMWRQQRSATQTAPMNDQPAHPAVIADSTSDLSMETQQLHQIGIVPLQVIFGDKVFRDQLDLTTEEFYAKLATSKHHPSTSQPAPGEFVAALDNVRADREAVIITISAALSGTYGSAQAGARLCRDRRIVVYDSQCLSLSMGMLVANAARLAGQGAPLDSVLNWLDRWRDDTGFVFTVATLKYLERGGRIGLTQSLLGSLLRVRPVFCLNKGELEVVARPRGDEEAFECVAREVEKRLGGRRRVRLGFVEIGQCDQLERLKGRLKKSFEVLESLRAAPTGVIGAHAGPGAWGVAFQAVRNDDPLPQVDA